MGNALIRRRLISEPPTPSSGLIEPNEYSNKQASSTFNDWGVSVNGAFDGDDTDVGWTNGGSSDDHPWISATFTARVLEKIYVVGHVGMWAHDFKVLGLNENDQWENCQADPSADCSFNTEIALNMEFYKGIKLQFNTFLKGSSSQNNNTFVKEIKLYGITIPFGSFDVTPASLTLNANNLTGTFTISNIVGSSDISILSYSDSLFTATKSGNTINVTATQVDGDGELTLKQNTTESYYGIEKTVDVSCVFSSKIRPNEFSNITASSTLSEDGMAPSNAFDGNTTDLAWTSAMSEYNAWISAEFSSVAINKINVIARAGVYFNPTFKVYGLTSGGTWENCQNDTSQNCSFNTDITLNGNSYRGIKVEWDSYLCGSSGGTANANNSIIKEIEVYKAI